MGAFDAFERKLDQFYSHRSKQIEELMLEINALGSKKTKKSKKTRASTTSSKSRLVLSFFKGKDVLNWIKEAENYFEICNIPKDLKVEVASLYIDGKAASWAEDYIERQKKNRGPNLLRLLPIKLRKRNIFPCPLKIFKDLVHSHTQQENQEMCPLELSRDEVLMNDLKAQNEVSHVFITTGDNANVDEKLKEEKDDSKAEGIKLDKGCVVRTIPEELKGEANSQVSDPCISQSVFNMGLRRGFGAAENQEHYSKHASDTFRPNHSKINHVGLIKLVNIKDLLQDQYVNISVPATLVASSNFGIKQIAHINCESTGGLVIKLISNSSSKKRGTTSEIMSLPNAITIKADLCIDGQIVTSSNATIDQGRILCKDTCITLLCCGLALSGYLKTKKRNKRSGKSNPSIVPDSFIFIFYLHCILLKRGLGYPRWCIKVDGFLFFVKSTLDCPNSIDNTRRWNLIEGTCELEKLWYKRGDSQFPEKGTHVY